MRCLNGKRMIAKFTIKQEQRYFAKAAVIIVLGDRDY